MEHETHKSFKNPKSHLANYPYDVVCTSSYQLTRFFFLIAEVFLFVFVFGSFSFSFSFSVRFFLRYSLFLLKRSNVVVTSPSGSGKTIALCIAALASVDISINNPQVWFSFSLMFILSVCLH